MEHKRGSLVPVAEVVSGLGGPVKAIREASPQARHHFTQADQVNQLVSERYSNRCTVRTGASKSPRTASVESQAIKRRGRLP